MKTTNPTFLAVTLAAFAFAGCATAEVENEGFILPAPLRAEVHGLEDRLDEWTDTVVEGMTAWNDAMTTAGCEAPFRLAADGERAYPIILYVPADWPHKGYGGMQHNGDPEVGWIHVLGREHLRQVLPLVVHELGHALWLAHTEDGADSVMTTWVSELIAPTARDTAEACPR